MALTKNMKRIGAAAHTEKVEERDYIDSVTRKHFEPTLGWQINLYEDLIATAEQDADYFAHNGNALAEKSCRELADRFRAKRDALQLEKDNLPQTLFGDSDDEILARRITMASDGCHPSPIISGGDILEIIPQAGHDEIPF